VQEAAVRIGPIAFGKEAFRVRDTTVPYSAVKHLRWYWSSKTVYFLNFQSAALSIHLNENEQPISLTSNTMFTDPVLAKTYSRLREMTWDVRTANYARQLGQEGCFTYRNVSFYTNGAIRSGADIFALKKATMDTFRLSVRLGGVFSRKLDLDLTLDHDIVHSLLEKFRTSPVDPEEYVRKIRDQRAESSASAHWFYDTIRLCALVASADGAVYPEEILVIKEFLRSTFRLEEGLMGQAITIFNEVIANPKPAAFYAERLVANHSGSPDVFPAILRLLRDIALSDGELRAKEQEILEAVADQFRRIGKAHGGKSGSERKNTEGKNGATSSDKEKYFGALLGLKGKVTVSTIRVCYRKKVLECHPDKFHGASEGERRRAHAAMLELNEAYAYFRERYDF